MLVRSCLFLLFFHSVYADNSLVDVDLWLPRSYQNHYLLMVEAAKKAQADKYCHQLINGQLSESRSSQEYLYFQFQCRTEDKMLFSIQVHGPELILENAYGQKQEELEAQRQAELAEKQASENKEAELKKLEELEALRQEQKKYWSICRKAIKKRLKYFDEVKIVSKIPPDPQINELEFTYNVHFDAVSPAKKPLFYQLRCVISGLEDFSLSIKRRKTQ